MTTRDPERRRLDALRKVIGSATPVQKMALKKMARMLGPDRLDELDANLREVEDKLVASVLSRGHSRQAAVIAVFSRLSSDDLPQRIKGMPLNHFTLSEETCRSLEGAGISIVGEFINKPRKELVEVHGIPEAAVEETRGILLSWGIRCVDNPPQAC